MDITNGLLQVRRKIAGFSLAMVISSLFAISAANAATFTDVQPSDWFYPYVEQLAADGIIKTSVSNYRPGDLTTRAEAAKLLVEGFDLTMSESTVSPFKDVQLGAWYAGYMITASELGFMNGYKDNTGAFTGNAGPNDPVTREQFAKMLVLAAPLITNTTGAPHFADMPTNNQFSTYVETAYNWSVLDGYPDGSFGGGRNINRAEVAKLVSNGMNPVKRPGAGFSVEDATALDSMSVEVCFSGDVGTGADVAGNYMITDAAGDELSVTDAEVSSDPMCVMLTTAAQVAKEDYDLTVSGVMSDSDEELDVTDLVFSGYVKGATASGDLTVEISASTPDGQTLPSGATSVPMATWNFGAGNEDAVLKSLVVHRYGVSSLPSDHQIYLYEGNERLTSGKSVNSTTNEATFSNLNLEIAAGDTRTITLRMDTGTVTSTGEVGYEIRSAADVNADAGTADGDFPVQGEKFDLSTTAAGTITIDANGSITNPKVGEDNATVAKFKLSTSGEGASLEQLNLYFTGSVTTDAIENLELYVSGEDNAIATSEGLNSQDLATFTFDTPYVMAKGDTRSFWVTADFNTGRNGDTVQIYLDETTDLVAIGDKYGFGMTVSSGGYDGVTGGTTDQSSSTLVGGDITISSNGPAATDVPTAGDDVELLNFSIATVSDITFKNFPISLTVSESADTTEGLLDSATGDANLTDIRIVNADSGETLWGPVDADVFVTTLGGTTAIGESTDAAQAFYLFTDERSMEAGEELNLSLTADIANTSTLDAMTIGSTLALGSTYPQIRDINNKTLTNSSSLVPSAAIAGKTMTVASPSLVLSTAAVPVRATSFVKGQEAVRFVGVTAACGSASDCKVTDVTLTGYLDEDVDNTFTAGTDNSIVLNSIVGSVWLEDEEGNVVAPAEAVQTAGTVTFDNLNWVIQGGDTPVFYVVGDVSTDAFKNSTNDRVAFAIATGGVTYEDDDSNSRTSTGAINGSLGASTGTWMSITGGGSLTVAVDSGTRKEDIVIAGAADQEVSKFKFSATDEAFLVTKLSVNARQSCVTNCLLTADLGDYDNNISQVKLSYTNSAGVTETKTSSLTNGTANFSGLDFWIDKDDDAMLTVSATLNTISGGAAAGEFVDLDVAFNQFEAVAQGSGETYKTDKIDASVASTSDLDFGTLTFTDSTDDLDTGDLVGTTTLGASASFTVDNGAGAVDQAYPVGTILCVDDNNDASCSSEDIYVITSTSAGSTELTITANLIDNAGDGTYDDADALLYALPGSGYLTATNHMHVYETKPTLAVAASSPSDARTVASSDNAFIFTIKADAQEQVTMRAATELTSTAAGNGAICTPAADTDAGDQVDGSSALCTTTGNTAGDTFAFDSGTTGLIDDYTRVNFWIKWTDAAAVASPTFTDIAVATDTTAVSTADQVTALSQTACGADQSTFVTGEWYNCDVAMPTGTDSGDQFVSIQLVDATELLATDTIHIDRLLLYNDKLTVDLTTDTTDVDTNANNTTNAGAPVAALLKEGGSTSATGYWATLTNGASSTNSASVTFIPTTEISIAKGTTKTFTLNTNTSTLLAEDGGSDDPVTFSIDMGTASSGTVTAGDFWWNDTNFSNVTAGSAPGSSFAFATTPGVIKWTGVVTDTTLNGNTLIY